MKKIIFAIAILGTTLSVHANNFNMPGFGNNNGYNNGTSWNMPNMNWGNGNGYNSGSNWNMPNFNTGNNNGYGRGSNWNMPSMNWGNNNGYGNGSNWNMPNMDWGNNNGYGNNWNMPKFNWNNNGSNANQNYGYNRPYYPTPRAQYRGPARPVAPQFMPRANTQQKVTPQIRPAQKPVMPTTKTAVPAAPVQPKIPTPDQVKGVILAPDNKVKVEATTEK